MEKLEEAETFILGYLDSCFHSTMERAAKTPMPKGVSPPSAFRASGAYIGEDGYQSTPDAKGVMQLFVARRKLFLIRHYSQKKLGNIFRCYVGDNTPDGDTYSQSIYLVEDKQTFLVVARSLACAVCHATGKLPATATRYFKTGKWRDCSAAAEGLKCKTGADSP